MCISNKPRLTFVAALLFGFAAGTGSLVAQEADVKSEAAEPRFQFTFRHAPWEEVLKALAEDCELEFSLDVIPGGTFNYYDKKRTFSADQAIDFVNGYLLIKGYTLMRQERMLLILDLREEIDRDLVRDMVNEVPLTELDKRGKYEITKTRFPVEKVDATEVNEQIKELLSPAGSLVVMPLAKEIIATDTAGNLRQIRDIIAKMERTASTKEKTLHTFRLENATAEEVLIVARPLLDIEADGNAPEDGSVRVSADPLGKTVFATGTPEKIALVKQVVEQVDGDAAVDNSDPVAQPVMEIHPVQAADPDAVLRVLQTMFVGEATLRLEIDRSTGGIMAMAPPAVHRSIQATIRQMEENPDTWAVIPLKGLDPEAALLLLEKMFSTATNPPLIGGTLVPPQLVARGTRAQLRQVELLVSQMTSSIEQSFVSRRQTGTTRMLQMNPADAAAILKRVEEIWPRLRTNDLHVVPLPESRTQDDNPRRRGRPYRDSPAEPRSIEEARDSKADSFRVKLTAFQVPPENDGKSDEDGDENQVAEAVTGAEAVSAEDDVVIAITPQGLLLNSNDTEALDELQTLLAALGYDPISNGGGSRSFYLQHTEAETAMTLITNIMNGVAVSSTTAEETTIIGSAMQEDGSSIAAIGAPHMVANKRLNAIYVMGSRSQINAVDRWVKLIDIESGPEEVLTFPKPRFIQVNNADATAVKTVLDSVFSNRIISENANNNQRGDRGDRGGGRGDSGGRGGFGGFGGFGGRGRGEDQNRAPAATQTASGSLPKMTLGVDEVNNAIVVSAPDPLFREVQAVVFEMDSRAGEQEPETIATVSLKGTNLETVKSALAGVLGDSAEISGATSSNRSTSSNRTTGGNRSTTPTGGGDQRGRTGDAGTRGGFGRGGGFPGAGGGRGGGEGGRGGRGGRGGGR